MSMLLHHETQGGLLQPLVLYRSSSSRGKYCPTLYVTHHLYVLYCPMPYLVRHISSVCTVLPYPVRYISSVCTVVPYPERMIASFQHFPLTATTKYPVTRQARNHVGSHIICTVRYSGVQCSTVQYSTVQCNLSHKLYTLLHRSNLKAFPTILKT